MNKALDEKTLEEKVIYDGKVVHLYFRTVELPNGQKGYREVVKHQGAVAVLVKTPDNKIILVNQFRCAPGCELVEIPAGKIDPGETADHAAVREMVEETGKTPIKMIKLGEIYSSPGFCDEKLGLYYCDSYEDAHQHLDDDEFLEVIYMSKEEVLEKAKNGEFKDAKTLSAIALAILNNLL